MQNLQVTVNQVPGTITWNFEELMEAVRAEMKQYENMVYDDTAIKSAKEDVAELRKLKKAVEDRRLEIRRDCLAPYTVIEEQAKQLVAVIDKPISLIAKQVAAYEEAQKAKRREEIQEYMRKAFGGFPENLAAKLTAKTYDTRWENATAVKKAWKQAIDTAAEHTAGDLKILEGIDDDYRAEAVAEYMKDLQLSQAMSKAQEMEKQKKAILERERMRQEQERLRQEELERRRAEAEARAQEQAQPDPEPETQEPVTEEVAEPVTEPEPEPARPARVTRTIRVTGTKEQLRKVLGYIEYVGASYEV